MLPAIPDLPQSPTVKVCESTGSDKPGLDFVTVLAAESKDQVSDLPEMSWPAGMAVNPAPDDRSVADAAGDEDEILSPEIMRPAATGSSFNGQVISEATAPGLSGEIAGEALLPATMKFSRGKQNTPGLSISGKVAESEAASQGGGTPAKDVAGEILSGPGHSGRQPAPESRLHRNPLGAHTSVAFGALQAVAEEGGGTFLRVAPQSLNQITSPASAGAALVNNRPGEKLIGPAPLLQGSGLLDMGLVNGSVAKSSPQMNVDTERRLFGMVRAPSFSGPEGRNNVSSVPAEAMSGEGVFQVVEPVTAGQGAELRGLLARGLQPENSGGKLPGTGARESQPTWPGAGTSLAGVTGPVSGSAPELSQRLGQTIWPASQIIDQVVSRVTLARINAETTLGLTLHPEELGEVRVELISDKEGLRVHLNAQNQLGQDVLEKHLSRLREAFELRGMKTQDLQVGCDARRDKDGGSWQEQGVADDSSSRAGGAGASDGTEPEQPLEAVVGSGWSTVDGFSLRI